MKKFLLISLSVVFCFGLIAQNEEKTVLKDEVLNGKIKTIYEKRIYNNGIDSFAYYFNELGLLIAEESSLFAGLNKKAIYTYNSDNQRVKTTMYDKEEKQTDYIEFVYESGNLIKRFYKFAKSIPKVTSYIDYEIDTYKYDENRNVIERKEIMKRKDSRSETLENHIKYQYDSIGNCTIEEKLNSRGKVVEEKKNEYNNGKLTETSTWQLFEGEDLYLKDIYEYNADDTMKLHTHIVYMYGSTDKEDFKWTENYFYEYEYDTNGRLIGETKTTTRTDIPIKKTTWKYIDFDNYGNWKQKTIGTIIINREIEYY